MATFDPLQADDPRSETFLPAAARRMAQSVGAAGATLWLWDEAARALQVVAAHGMTDEYLAYARQCARLPAAQARAPVYLAYKAGARIHTAHPIAHPEFRYFTEAFDDSPIAGLQTGPIALSGTRVGAWALYFHTPDELSETQMLRLELHSTEVAVHVLGAARHRELACLDEELEQTNALRERLQMLDRLKRESLGAIADGLRSRLSTVTDRLGPHEAEGLPAPSSSASRVS